MHLKSRTRALTHWVSERERDLKPTGEAWSNIHGDMDREGFGKNKTEGQTLWRKCGRGSFRKLDIEHKAICVCAEVHKQITHYNTTPRWSVCPASSYFPNHARSAGSGAKQSWLYKGRSTMLWQISLGEIECISEYCPTHTNKDQCWPHGT